MSVCQVVVTNNRWFCQVDGLAMGASLAVNLANLWMKSFEHQIKSRKTSSIRSLEIVRSALNATVDSPIEKNESYVRTFLNNKPLIII